MGMLGRFPVRKIEHIKSCFLGVQRNIHSNICVYYVWHLVIKIFLFSFVIRDRSLFTAVVGAEEKMVG